MNNTAIAPVIKLGCNQEVVSEPFAREGTSRRPTHKRCL